MLKAIILYLFSTNINSGMHCLIYRPLRQCTTIYIAHQGDQAVIELSNVSCGVLFFFLMKIQNLCGHF